MLLFLLIAKIVIMLLEIEGKLCCCRSLHNKYVLFFLQASKLQNKTIQNIWTLKKIKQSNKFFAF